MLLIRFLVLLILIVVFIQDLKSRSVYWILFFLLAILFFEIGFLQDRSFLDIVEQAWMNCCFLLIQLLLVSAYFSIKYRQWVNITSELIGWGDILLLLSITFYFSLLNFIFFYLFSLILIILGWTVLLVFLAKKDKQIPMAGIQAIYLAIFLMSDWYLLHFNSSEDTWLLNLIHK